MDLICNRYPGTKPSEYLGVKDGWTAFQLDSALALKGYKKDNEIKRYQISLINWHILQVCRSLGAKGIPKSPPTLAIDEQPESPNDVPSLKQVFNQLGTTGTVLERKLKNG